jgi:hypothetical protein
MADGESQSSDPNPYEVAEVTEPDVFLDRSRPPGLIVTFLTVVLGLVVATAAFGASFLICLGLVSTSTLPNAAGVAIVFGVSGLAFIATFLFTVWGLLKTGKLFRD